MSAPDLSVVIPAFNEEDRLERSLDSLIDYLSSRQWTFEVIIVDDGSADGTARVASDFAAQLGRNGSVRLLRNSRNRGKGYSVRRGMLEAQGRLALLTDADLSTPIEEIGKLEVKLSDKGYDAAIGSRDVEGAEVVERQSLWRETSGKLFNRFMRLCVRLPFHDTQCGFKLFRRDAVLPVFERQQIEGFGFDVEVLYIMQRMGLRVAEVPVVWSNASGSKVTLRSGFRALLDLWTIRRNGRRGVYD